MASLSCENLTGRSYTNNEPEATSMFTVTLMGSGSVAGVRRRCRDTLTAVWKRLERPQCQFIQIVVEFRDPGGRWRRHSTGRPRGHNWPSQNRSSVNFNVGSLAAHRSA